MVARVGWATGWRYAAAVGRTSRISGLVGKNVSRTGRMSPPPSAILFGRTPRGADGVEFDVDR